MLSKIKKLLRAPFEPMPLDNNFDNYDEYWESRGFHKPAAFRGQVVSGKVDEDSTFMDIGFGEGTIMEYLHEHNKPKKIVGIDISEKAVKYVRDKGFEAEVYDILSDDFAKYLEGKTFDYVVITEVLEHITDPEQVIELLKNHVNKAIFISIPNSGFYINRIRLLFGRFPLVMIQQHVKEHIRFWTKKDFYYWAEYHGYKVKSATTTSGMGIKLLEPLENTWQNMFANQILYEIVKKSD